MARRLAVLAALLVVLARPGIALADTDILGGFTSGVSDFVSPSNEQVIVTPEQDFNDSYEPVLVEENRQVDRVINDDSTTNDYINDTIDKFYNVNWFGMGNRSWLNSLIIFLGNTGFFGMVIVSAIGMVFIWWGVRKAIRVIMAAWRKGHASV